MDGPIPELDEVVWTLLVLGGPILGLDELVWELLMVVGLTLLSLELVKELPALYVVTTALVVEAVDDGPARLTVLVCAGLLEVDVLGESFAVQMVEGT